MSSTVALDRDRYVAFAFAAGDVLVETDARGRVRYAAGAIARFVPDASAETLAGRSFLDCVRDPDRALLELLLEEIAAGGRRGPVTVTAAAGDAVASCWLLHTPATDGFHLVLRRCDGRPPPPAPRGAEPDTGLLGADRLGELAEQEFLRQVATDQTLVLSLVKLAGPDGVGDGGDGSGGAVIRRVAAALRAVSFDGGSAARAGTDRFALVHRDGEGERLDRLLRAGLDAAGAGSVRIERQALRLSDPTLSPNQIGAAVRHVLDQFAADGRMDVDDLADALGRQVTETAARVAAARAVIDSRAFFVLYQPIVRLADGAVHHHEALARMHDGDRDIFDFVTFAETIGFITDFDLAVAREVFDELARLRRRRERPAIAVNLSARSLLNEAFIERLLALSRSAGDNARQVMFEVTESFQLTDLDRADAVIQQLRRLGHQVCLDDFGAGAAAFHYIRALDVDYVKLDGAFVQRVQASERDRTILAGMVELCRSLEVATVAETVETAEQAEGLRRLGVDYGQGWLFGRPAARPSGTGRRR